MLIFTQTAFVLYAIQFEDITTYCEAKRAFRVSKCETHTIFSHLTLQVHCNLLGASHIMA